MPRAGPSTPGTLPADCGFGSGIAICPAKDAAIFIGMNQVGADPAEKGVEILRRLP